MFFLHACFASLARLIVIYTVMWNYVIVSHRKLLFWMVIDCARMFYNCYFCHCRECLYFQRCVYMFRWFFKKLFSLSLVSIDLMRIGLRSVYFVRCVWFLYTFIFLFFFLFVADEISVEAFCFAFYRYAIQSIFSPAIGESSIYRFRWCVAVYHLAPFKYFTKHSIRCNGRLYNYLMSCILIHFAGQRRDANNNKNIHKLKSNIAQHN